MFLQLGGLPDPTSSPASQLFYWLWMLFVVEQWAASGMAAVSNVLAFASFELQNQVRQVTGYVFVLSLSRPPPRAPLTTSLHPAERPFPHARTAWRGSPRAPRTSTPSYRSVTVDCGHLCASFLAPCPAATHL